MSIGDHPDIESTLRTGYPAWNQPRYYECDRCHEELNADEAYCDERYDTLCEFCLRDLHKKAW